MKLRVRQSQGVKDLEWLLRTLQFLLQARVGRVPCKVLGRRGVIRAVFSKIALTTVWRKDPTLTPAWPLYPSELNGG